MKAKIFIISLFLLTLVSGNILAQENVAAIAPFNLLILRIAPSYERVLNDKLTVGLNFDYQIHRKLFGGFDFDSEDTDFSVGGFKWGGIRATPQLKFYPSGEAPHGFYIGPYFRYTFYNVKGEGSGVDNNGVYHDNELTVRSHGLGGGFLMGYQWIVGEHVAIDFNFFGLGIGSNRITVDLTGTNYTKDDFEEVDEDVEANIDDAPLIKVVDTEVRNDGVEGTFRLLLPQLRFGLRIGYAW